MKQVTITPKFKVGDIVETKANFIGKIETINADIHWSSKENGISVITYYLRNQNDLRGWPESEITKVLEYKKCT